MCVSVCVCVCERERERERERSKIMSNWSSIFVDFEYCNMQIRTWKIEETKKIILRKMCK